MDNRRLSDDDLFKALTAAWREAGPRAHRFGCGCAAVDCATVRALHEEVARRLTVKETASEFWREEEVK